MKHFILVLSVAFLAISCMDAPDFKIHNGVNIAHWLSQSAARGENRAQFFTETDIKQIAAWGFDHVRIPIDEEQMFHEDGSKDEEAFALLHQALNLCLKYRLRVVVDLHILRTHYFDAEVKPLFSEEWAQEAFYECWRKLSGELCKYSTDWVAYELMNEPVADNPEDWNVIVMRCHAAIRKLEKNRVLVIGSNRWQSFNTAKDLFIPEGDPNIILSFHYYNPMILSHYRAGWTEYRDYGGPVHYPGQTVLPEELALLPEAQQEAFGHWAEESYDKERFAAEFQQVLDVAKRYGIPVYCGEYGCLSVPANAQQRYAWLADMNKVFDSLGIARAVWCYKEGPGGFGIFSSLAGGPDERMLESINPKQTGSVQDKPWQEISPSDIELNAIQMIDKDWLEVSAGKEGNMNLMTISWGSIGELWGKPVFIVYVSTSRYTHKFMEENDYFTVTHFPADMRKQLSYLGRVSGRDEDKVAGAGLTVEFTDLGNPIYAQADLAIECKKLYGQQFDANLLPEEQREWYERTGIGIHYMYIGEILHVWKK